jgi:hypothetical protein
LESTSLQGIKLQIERELNRIQESAEYSKEAQFAASKSWRAANLCLGVPASVLAAIAGGAGLADSWPAEWVGAAALLVAVLGGVMTTLNAAQRAEQSAASANSYLTIFNDARVLRNVDLPRMTDDEARDALAQLIARRDEINLTTPLPSARAFRQGRRNIEKGRTKYDVDER